MRKTKLIMSVGLVVLVMGSLVHSAPSLIKDFSSKGGHTQNNDGPRDRMYLVKPCDKITFSVMAQGAQKYEWQVNKKVDVKATGETFIWTVPSEKGIWEIHVKATGLRRAQSSRGGEETHQEWVVSTLKKSGAPVLFDYFCPDRSQKDPWGRPLPKWDKEINRPDYTLHRTAAVTPSKTAYGTWIWQRR